MNEIKPNDLLQKMQALAAQASGQAAPQGSANVDFGKLLGDAIEKVNDVQAESGKLKASFDTGDPNISLAEVMMASQKANIAFQAAVQVRNKLVQAYQDVMNMPI